VVLNKNIMGAHASTQDPQAGRLPDDNKGSFWCLYIYQDTTNYFERQLSGKQLCDGDCVYVFCVCMAHWLLARL